MKKKTKKDNYKGSDPKLYKIQNEMKEDKSERKKIEEKTTKVETHNVGPCEEKARENLQ